MSATSAVARATLTLWVRDVARVTHTSTRQVFAGVIVSAVLATALGAMLALIAAGQIVSDVPAELRTSMLRSSLGGGVITAAAIAVAVGASAPPRTALQNLMDLLPVGRAQARLGQMLPSFAVSVAYTVALSTSGALVLVRLNPHPAASAASLTLYALLLVTALVLSTGMMTLLHSAACALRLPHQYGIAIAGVLTLGAAMGATVPDIFATQPADGSAWGPLDLLPHRAFARFADAFAPIDGALPVLWIAAAAALMWAASRTTVAASASRRPSFPRGTRPPMATAFWAHAWAESLIAVRSPQFLTVAVLAPVAMAGLWAVAAHPVVAMLAPSLSGAVVVLPFMLALYAVGRTATFSWIARASGASVRAHLGARALAYIVVPTLLAAPLALIAVSTGLLPLANLGTTALRCLLATLAALLAGALVPYSEQQPLSATAGGFVLAVIYLLVSLGITWVSTDVLPDTEAGLTIAAIAVFAGGYAMIGDRLHGADGPRAA
ncbi:hypothetical protein [Microbacterium nymphoidis]|uniref:hypothetical protein n=1 Tax=Microbacterium nymphoidis TaxID=2898586 RepID=UPI001E4A096E|nr:hypothetical protein [Microbacterium nymphoidis]MCD2499478.1 hypothetical protein [Microbacterium nymphoidis]